MKVYIDAEFKCHLTGDDTTTAVETDFFNSKCESFIEGYRFIPEGKSWTRSDGEVFRGEMIAPLNDFDKLDAVQRDYERERLADAESALAILLGGASE